MTETKLIMTVTKLSLRHSSWYNELIYA